MIKLTRIEQKRPERKISNDLQHINIGLMVYPIPQRNTITMDIVKKNNDKLQFGKQEREKIIILSPVEPFDPILTADGTDTVEELIKFTRMNNH